MRAARNVSDGTAGRFFGPPGSLAFAADLVHYRAESRGDRPAAPRPWAGKQPRRSHAIGNSPLPSSIPGVASAFRVNALWEGISHALANCGDRSASRAPRVATRRADPGAGQL